MAHKYNHRRNNAPVRPSDLRGPQWASKTSPDHDNDNDWPDFETEAEAFEEDSCRLGRLEWHLPPIDPNGRLRNHPKLNAALRSLPLLRPRPLACKPLTALAAKLRGAIDYDEQVTSLGSSVAMRAIRKRVIGAMLQAFEKYPDEELRTGTVIKNKWTYTQAELAKASAKKIKGQFYTDLNQTGILKIRGPFLAFLHGEFEPSAGVYVLHWHVLTTAEKAEALHRLTTLGAYKKTHTGAVPIMTKPLKNRCKQFSYLLKSMWLQRAYRPETGKRDRRGVRITEPYHSLYLLWLDRQGLRNISIINDCWSTKLGGPAAMRDLYLSIHEGRGKTRKKVCK